MNPPPRISVVMGVYNGEETLRGTIQSIMTQTFRDWEFIIVDDASTDSTSRMLESYALQDSRIRVLRHSQNRGLTRALIAGCSEARGELIARQDNGDYAFPERFAKQLAFLQQNHDVVAVSCGIRRIGPKREFLGDAIRDLSPQEVTKVFLETGKAIIHATAMIRRTAFEAAGGYRAQFRVAQDIDLWYRLSEFGLLAELPEPLSYISIDLRGISAHSNSKQHQLAQIARESYLARKANTNESTHLQNAELISDETRTRDFSVKRDQRGDPFYFIGSELYSVRNAACRPYFGRAICFRYRIIKSFLKYFNSFFVCSRLPACNLVKPLPEDKEL